MASTKRVGLEEYTMGSVASLWEVPPEVCPFTLFDGTQALNLQHLYRSCRLFLHL
jgi:hypothetical protein